MILEAFRYNAFVEVYQYRKWIKETKSVATAGHFPAVKLSLSRIEQQIRSGAYGRHSQVYRRLNLKYTGHWIKLIRYTSGILRKRPYVLQMRTPSR